LLKEIAISEYEIKIINNEQIKIQPKSFTTYINIVKELKSKDTEFHVAIEAKKDLQSSTKTHSHYREYGRHQKKN